MEGSSLSYALSKSSYPSSSPSSAALSLLRLTSLPSAETFLVLDGPSVETLRVRISCPSVEVLGARLGDRGDIGDADDASLTSNDEAEAFGVGTAASWSSGHCTTKVFGLGVFSEPPVLDRELPLRRKFEGLCGYRFDRTRELRAGMDGTDESEVSSAGGSICVNEFFFRVSFRDGACDSIGGSTGSTRTTDPNR